MRKICLLELLSAKNVKSFSSIRQDEVLRMIEIFRSSFGETVNATKKFYQFTSSMTCRATFGKVLKEQDELILLIKKTSKIVEGFNVADIFPSLKFLHVLCGMKGKIMDAHHELDAILENIINELKKNSELGGEGLVSTLLRLMKEGEDAGISDATVVSREISSPLAEENSNCVDNVESHPELFGTFIVEHSSHVDNLFDEMPTRVFTKEVQETSSDLEDIQPLKSLNEFFHSCCPMVVAKE
ncbi:hypothetical protein H5410_000686 [Solanum commersonii]|uniref:Uncharacterized protein n=1 Tax=Solanum commersonii TaxID=4109 RepID=A0A9J6AX74_SOLCO|nr:hypothetical protein H5410_000686 [Solanum commersonii]